MPGRPPIPTALRRLQGNPGKRALNDAEPQPKRGLPDRPKWLPASARPFWDSLTKALDEMGVLTKADSFTVAMMADALADWSRGRAFVEKHGQVYASPTPTGGIIRRAHPEVAIASDAMKRFNSLAAQFGLSASSRAKLTVQPKKDIDPLDELRLRRRRKVQTNP